MGIPTTVSFHGKQVVIRTTSLDWGSVDKLLESELFSMMLSNYTKRLRHHDSEFLKLIPKGDEKRQEELLLLFMKKIAKEDGAKVLAQNPELAQFFSDTYLLDRMVEDFYNYWRNHERYLICLADPKASDAEDIEKRPYRTFNDTIEKLNHVVRKLYRDMQENITGEHPLIYRQVPAGCQVSAIAKPKRTELPAQYSALGVVPVITQVLMNPPIMIDPPMNKRKGEFALVDSNPLEGLKFNPDEWLCFPAKVGDLVVYLYFHNFYTGLSIATANLFELCSDADLKRKPDAIYAYGVPHEALKKYAPEKTVFYNDEKNKLMVGAIPLGEEFAYFGYIKKMMLTLHNAIMIKRGRLPVHGAMVRITLKSGEKANIVFVGDSGAGKSESIEAFRILSGDNLKEMKVVFDDMGSLELAKEGKIRAYGTETGAFVRLDDLEAGYAFGQLDRSIIMSPHKINARVVVPITTLKEVLHGWHVDYFLYANNYDKADDGVYLGKFSTPQEAMDVFREGKRMAKGTTQESGITTSYYANIFGPTQLKDEHDPLAEKYFNAMFKEGIFVGQIRTQLGIDGMEMKGPQLAAKALMEKMLKKKNE